MVKLNDLCNIKQNYFKLEIIVIDGFFRDDIVKISKKIGGVMIIQQSKKFSGNGIPMKTDLNKVIYIIQYSEALYLSSSCYIYFA